MLVGGNFLPCCRDRADQAVTQKNSQERAHQGGRNFLADFFWRAAHRAHGDHNPEYGSDNAGPGKESATLVRAAVGCSAS